MIPRGRPKEFFNKLKRSLGHQKPLEDEVIYIEDTPENRVGLRESPFVSPVGRILVSGASVDKFLCRSLEQTFNPPGCGTLHEVATQSPLVMFTEAKRSDQEDDERFVSASCLNDLIEICNGEHSSGPDCISNSIVKVLPEYFRKILQVIFSTVEVINGSLH